MKHKSMRNKVVKPFFAVGLMLSTAFAFNACDDELPEGQPSWLGNSIYERLTEEGNYKTTLQLIDDLNQTEVLSHTGSKTLFVANDDAFAEWFKNNKWGVRNYGQLSLAQKKLLLNSSMINNAYLIELMSNVSGNPPEAGQCMRRSTAVTIYDSVYVIKPEEMPKTSYWDRYRSKKNGIVLFKDNTSSPMIHFLPAFMQRNKITDEDLNIMTNGEAQSASEAWINGKKVIERDITCKNGYIHKVEGVVESAQNMAEIIRNTPEMKMWSDLLDRFCAPYFDKTVSDEYNRLYNTEDSAFVLRYFSKAGYNRSAQLNDPDGMKVPATLTFDPGWNQYMYSNTMGRDMHYDAGMMIVPTNEALQYWWEHDGKVLQDEYGSWEDIPLLTLSKLINVNMIETMTDKGVVSKFDNIVDDAKLPLGIKKDHIVKSYMGSNGLVYLVNRVFPPREYSSVTFPALAHQASFSSIYWAIDNLEFTPYLNSMDSYYSLILPTDSAMRYYVDPAHYGEAQQRVYSFYFDKEDNTLKADLYNCTVGEDGKVTLGNRILAEMPSNLMNDRLEDMMNQMIIVGDVEDGFEYYKTKAGNFVRVENAGKAGQMTFMGAWQDDYNRPLAVDTIYDMSMTGNGKAYMVSEQMPLGSTKSVYMTLSENPEFSEFLQLLMGGDEEKPEENLMTKKLGKTNYYCVNQDDNYNMSLFDNYNYTVYVPSNASIRELIDKGILPTWEDYAEYDAIYKGDGTEAEKAYALKAKNFIKDRITDFVRYHVQDHSVAVNGAPDKDEVGNYLFTNKYETMKINPENKRFYSLEVNQQTNAITVTDVMGNTRNVNTSAKGLYNNLCRDIWLETSGRYEIIYTSSDAVVHLIDGPLFYNSNWQLTWEEALKLEGE